jgi:hypothetical protein
MALTDDELYKLCKDLNDRSEKYEQKDRDHLFEKMVERMPELGKKVEHIEVASIALVASNSMVLLEQELARNPPAQTPQCKPGFAKKISEELLLIKDLGDAREVNQALFEMMKKLDKAANSLPKGPARTNLEKCSKGVEKCANDLKDIIMGVKVDHTGTTRLSHANSQVLGGPLGTVMGLGFNKLQAESSNNQAGQYITGFITKCRNELGLDLKHAAESVLSTFTPKPNK